MPVPPAILFDLDDTLVAFDAVAEPAWQQVVRHHALQAGTQADVLRTSIREHSAWYWSDAERHRAGRQNLAHTRRQLVREALRKLGRDEPELADRIADDYTQLRSELMYLLPGVLPLLTTLRGRGVRLGLVTNGTAQEQRQKIDRFALAPFFEFIQVEGELGVGKPDDAAYVHALARLALPAADVWFVGDNLEWDVLAPQRHGIKGVWVKGEDASLPILSAQPHHQIPNTAALVGLLGLGP